MPGGTEHDDVVRQSEEYLSGVLQDTGVPLGPKPERVTEHYADERIREKIMHFDNERARAGLWSINQVLKDRDVPPALRLHLITSVAHLGRISKDTLHARQDRSAPEERSW